MNVTTLIKLSFFDRRRSSNFEYQLTSNTYYNNLSIYAKYGISRY